MLNERHTMVLEASNSFGSQTFQEYVQQLKSKVGVAMSSQFLMYVMAKGEQADSIERIG